MSLGWNGNRDDYTKKEKDDVMKILQGWHYFGYLNDKQEAYIRKAIEDGAASVYIDRDDYRGVLVVKITLIKPITELDT